MLYYILLFRLRCTILWPHRFQAAVMCPEQTSPQGAANILNPKRTPRHQKLEKEKQFISTAHWHISAKKSLHQGAVVSFLCVFFLHFLCPNLSHMDYNPFPPGCRDALQNDRCWKLSPRSTSLSLSHIHTHTLRDTHPTNTNIKLKYKDANLYGLTLTSRQAFVPILSRSHTPTTTALSADEHGFLLKCD